MRTAAALRRNLRKLVARLLGALRPRNLRVLARNAVDSPRERRTRAQRRPAAEIEPLMERALAWICHSQDRVGSGGVGSYDFSGWSTGYPEVTGYIIPTVYDCAHLLARDELAERARRMADWELGIQRPEGGFEGGNEGDGLPPVVFNTGQVLRGVLRTYEETGEERYLAAAVRAGDWIASMQDDDGSWTRSNHLGLKRTYDTYVAAPLAQLAELTGDGRYGDAARRNCDFVLAHQRPNGWFELCDNSPDHNDAPVTHTICYTADGLIETGERLDEPRYVEAGARAGRELAARVEPSGYLAGRFDEAWRPRVRWVCLTGSAQLGIVLMRLHERGGEREPLEVAERLLSFLAHVERLNAIGADRTGAIAGSYPIWGPYAPFRFPCWATKYHLDLLRLVRAARADVTNASAVAR